MPLSLDLHAVSRLEAVKIRSEVVRLRFSLVPAPSSQGRRLLLIHGNPSQLGDWASCASFLLGHGDILAYDQPGFGQSADYSDGGHSLERSAEAARAMMDHVGWTEPVDVIAHSHGGLIAIALRALHPRRIRSLVLIATAGTPAHGTYRVLGLPLLDRLLAWIGPALYRSPRLRPLARFITGLVVRRLFAPGPVSPALVEQELDALGERPLRLCTMAQLAKDDPCRKVKEYARHEGAPALFIHGEDDRIVPKRFARNLFSLVRDSSRGSRLASIAGGHMLHLDAVESLRPLLDEWLMSQDAGDRPLKVSRSTPRQPPI